MTQYTVTFDPFGKTVAVEAGVTLLDAASKARIAIESPCGGDGICGRCRLIVKHGNVAGDVTGLLTREEIRQGYVLACQTTVQGDLEVEIPPESRAKELVTTDLDAQRFRADGPQVETPEFPKDPLVAKVFLKLSPPTLTDNESDCDRIRTQVEKITGITAMQTGLKIIRRFPDILRRNDFAVTALVGRRADIAEIMDIEGGDTSDRNFLAVADIGTSTLVLHLVDAGSAATVDTQACFNSQSVYGREVTARMIAAERVGDKALQTLLVEDLNRLISAIASRNHINLADITAVVCAGNTAMVHFLLGLPTRHLRRSPCVDVTNEPPPLRAAEVGLKINSRGLLFTVPGIGGWVGGDVAAGIIASGLFRSEQTAMLIDVGTNGEIVLGDKDWLIACSASAGPALEGAGVECGMMAERGAIEKVWVENGALRYEVIGGGPPDGICGSGVIDLVASLLEIGVIDRGGGFVERRDPALVIEDDLPKYVLAGARTGSAGGREIYISRDDINNVVIAKAAIFAASKIMLDRLGLTFREVSKLFIAGGFGSHINVENAVAIGLIPNIGLDNIQYVGNTSILGAKLAALSTEAYETLRGVAKRTTYYDLMGTHDYVEQFQQAMFLPHTNIEMFAPQTGMTPP